jgi:uncharacterized glyoxalase superfamily protein PhnB
MPGHGVIPAIRVRDMAAGLAFYVGRLGFTLERGGPTEDNSAIARGDARLMIEVAGDLYSPGYNEAIRRRLGSPSAMALYIEAADLDDLYARLEASGVEIVDPLADRPWGQNEFTVADPDGNWLTFWRASGGELTPS